MTSLIQFSIPALLLVGLSVPALAQDSTGNTPAPIAADKPVKEKKVCRREADTGSNIPHSTCHTRAEWTAIDAQTQSNAANTLRDARVGNH